MIPAYLPACSDIDMFHYSHVPNTVVLPPFFFTGCKIVSSIHDADAFRARYCEIVAVEHRTALTGGFILNKLFGSSTTLRNAAQILLILRRALDLTEHCNRVCLAWHKLFVVWVSVPAVTITKDQTEWDIQYNQAMWKLNALYDKLIPFVTALWELSISHRLLIESFKASSDEAIQTLPVNLRLLSKKGSLVEGLKAHEQLTQKILTLFHVQTPAKEWVAQVEDALKHADTVYHTGHDVARNVTNTAVLVLHDLVCRGAVVWQTTFGRPPTQAA